MSRNRSNSSTNARPIPMCDLYKLLGDTAQMKRAGCPIPPNASPILKTIPSGSGRGEETDEAIAEIFQFILLGLLLMVAICMLLVCCCRAHTRFTARRALLIAQYNNRPTAARKGFVSSGGPCSCSPRPGFVPPTQARQTGNIPFRPARASAFGDECHTCQTEVNLV